MEKTKATISLEGLDPLFRSLPFGTKKYSKNPSLLVTPVIPKGIQVRKTRNLWTRNDHRWVLRANENARRFSRPKSSLNRLWSDDCGGSFSMPWRGVTIMVIWSRCLRCTTWGRSMIPIIPYSTHDTQEAPPNRMKWQFNTLWHEGWPQNENGVKKYSGILIVLQGKILTYFSMQQFWHLSISSHWVPHWSYPFIRSQVGLVEVVDHPMDRIKHLKHREKDTAEIRTLRCPRCRKKRGLVLENPL